MAIPDAASLVERTCLGDDEAWRELFARLVPEVQRRVRSSRSFAGFRQSDDDVMNVVTSVFERLKRDGFRALRLAITWQATNPDKTFDDWLTIVTTNVIRDYVSARLTNHDGLPAAVQAELDDETVGSSTTRRRPGSSTLATAYELGELAQRTLPADQLGALHDWLQGFDFAEVASRHQIASAHAAEKLVRAALARLRRHIDAG